MTDDKRCGNCKHWVRIRAHEGQCGSLLVCKPERAEYWEQFEVKRYAWNNTIGYEARHQCHRPDDYEAEEEV